MIKFLIFVLYTIAFLGIVEVGDRFIQTCHMYPIQKRKNLLRGLIVIIIILSSTATKLVSLP